jgi:hypothetical protein
MLRDEEPLRPAHEILLFNMTGAGMEVVGDPSTFFLQDRDPACPARRCAWRFGPAALCRGSPGPGDQDLPAIPAHGLGFDANRLHCCGGDGKKAALNWAAWTSTPRSAAA